MGRKIFVSYKFSDNQVEKLSPPEDATVRDYVTEFENLIDSSDHIYKGESDGEDLSELSEETIWQKLRDRIYDSSITIIFISPGMREVDKKDRDQWIPWEISYSLKETSRKNKNEDPITSKTNAMIAVVLPDKFGHYSYYLEESCSRGHVTHHTGRLFRIIGDNKFNLRSPEFTQCCDCNNKVWPNDCSYISAVKWTDFKRNYNKYIKDAYKRQNNIDEYKITKVISEE